jgi:hypothetical protein
VKKILFQMSLVTTTIFAGFDTMSALSSATHSANTASNSGDITVSWEQAIANGGDTLQGYYYILDSTANTLIPNVVDTRSSLGSAATSATISDKSDGNYYFHLAPYATSGNTGATLHFGPIVIDKTNPAITITPDTGSYNSAQTVTLSSTDANEEAIYYTIDGSNPTTSSTRYTSSFAVSATTTLKVLATDTAGNSNTAQAVYTINSNSNIASFGSEVTNGSEVLLGGSVTYISVLGNSLSKYKYKIDSDSYSPEKDISDNKILINTLSEGSHTISIIGYDDSSWQSESSATTISFTIVTELTEDTSSKTSDESSNNSSDDSSSNNSNSNLSTTTPPTTETEISIPTTYTTNSDDTKVYKYAAQTSSSGKSVVVQKLVHQDGSVTPTMEINGQIVSLPNFPFAVEEFKVFISADGAIKIRVVSPLKLPMSF